MVTKGEYSSSVFFFLFFSIFLSVCLNLLLSVCFHICLLKANGDSINRIVVEFDFYIE